MVEDPFVDVARYALAATDDQVGPACMNVEVPPTINMDHDFREAYVQGYRHALADARRVIASSRNREDQ
jgi:hypothetical protein